MKIPALLIIGGLSVWYSINASAAAFGVEPRVGDSYEIVRVQETSQQRGDASSGSSYDKDTISVRVISIQSDGLSLEYDLPRSATTQEREAAWQFPAKIFRPFEGPIRLLNGSELAARVDDWLHAAGWSRDM